MGAQSSRRSLDPMLSLVHPCHDALFAPSLFHAHDLLLARVAHGLASAPQLHMSQTDTGYSLEAQLPGTKPSDVHVSVECLELIVRAKLANDNGLRSRFERRLTLPVDADAGKAVDSYENGILRIEVPKKEPAAPFEIGLVEPDVLPPTNGEEGGQAHYRETIAAPGVAPTDLKITCAGGDVEIVGRTKVRGMTYGILTLVVPKRLQTEGKITLLPAIGDDAACDG